MEERYTFCQCDDGDWYLIPVELKEDWYEEHDKGIINYYEFRDKFRKYLCDTPYYYTFINPEKEQ